MWLAILLFLSTIGASLNSLGRSKHDSDPAITYRVRACRKARPLRRTYAIATVSVIASQREHRISKCVTGLIIQAQLYGIVLQLALFEIRLSVERSRCYVFRHGLHVVIPNILHF